MQVLSDCHQAPEGGTNGTRRIYEKIVRKNVLYPRPTGMGCQYTASPPCHVKRYFWIHPPSNSGGSTFSE